MEMIQPILLANIKELLVMQMKPSEVIYLMKLNKWTNDKLKYDFNFHCALKEIINQTKWN
jgi:hypothetical protein